MNKKLQNAIEILAHKRAMKAARMRRYRAKLAAKVSRQKKQPKEK